MQETYYSNHFVLIGLLLDNSFSVCYVRTGITESLFEYQHYNFRIAFIIEIPSKPCSKYRQLLQYPRVWGFFFQMRPLNNCYFGFVFYLQNFETVLCSVIPLYAFSVMSIVPWKSIDQQSWKLVIEFHLQKQCKCQFIDSACLELSCHLWTACMFVSQV